MRKCWKSQGWIAVLVILAVEVSAVSGYQIHTDTGAGPRQVTLISGSRINKRAVRVTSNGSSTDSWTGLIPHRSARTIWAGLTSSGQWDRRHQLQRPTWSERFGAWKIGRGSGARPQFLDWLNSTGPYTIFSPSAKIRFSPNAAQSLRANRRDWGYTSRDGPTTWMTRYPECSGVRQSPINIVTSRMRFRDIEPMSMLDYTPLSSTFTVTYNGAGLTLRPRSKIHLTGLGDGEEIYTIANIHFHWSSHNSHGSEHAIDGVKFPMEMHVLCYNTKYGSRNASMAHKDGLAAMAVIWDIGEPSLALWPIIAATTRMTTVGEEVPSSGLDLTGLFPTKSLPMFRYHGSMTTPPCKENVMWTICEHVQTMSYQQFKMFQDMRRGPLAQNGFIGDNSRPLQAAYSRIIVTNNPLFSG